MEELPLTIAYEITRLRQIKDKDIAQQYMLQMFEDYKTEKFSIDEMNRRITGKIEFEKSKESEVEERAKERIIELNS